jgi:hypothetical protein
MALAVLLLLRIFQRRPERFDKNEVSELTLDHH